ncbi:DNA repair ATPase, partial [Lysobacter sp. 2RAB21]
GERITDLRVFRWSVSPDGEVRYIDNRGERDIALPAPFDFEWTRATREMVVNGRHPHLNILDSVFVETVNGDLTVKIENNTEDGQGIYREPVADKTQSLDDAQVDFAKVGSLILLKILPYR